MSDSITKELTLFEIAKRVDQVWYVAHPLSPTKGEVEFWQDARDAMDVNLQTAKRWLAWLRRSYPAITFIAPWIVAVESGADDANPEERARGLRDDVRRCSGVVLCGGRISSGMQQEADAAVSIIDLTALGAEPPR